MATQDSTAQHGTASSAADSMAFWMMPFRVDGVDGSRDGNFYWQDMGGPGGAAGDMGNDLLGQFVDLDGDGLNSLDSFPSTLAPGEALFLMDEPPPPPLPASAQHCVSESTGSSGVSTADDLDFLSNSSLQRAATATATATTTHEIDPRDLALDRSACVSESDLTRLESISLDSPHKNPSHDGEVSPTGPGGNVAGAAGRKARKLAEVLLTIRKATTLRKTWRPLPEQRAESPPALKPPKQRRGRAVTHQETPHSPPLQQYDGGGTPAMHGFGDDSFGGQRGRQQMSPAPIGAPGMGYYGQAGIDTPLESPGIKSELCHFPSGLPGPPAGWAAHPHHGHGPPAECMLLPEQWSGTAGDLGPGPEQSWWELGIFHPGDGEFASHHHRSVNMASHAQHSDLPYEYAPMPDPSTAGLMIHMPQPTLVSDLAVHAQAYLPPPPPPPPPPKAAGSERPHRPPRAKSSGARHLSCSPVRRQSHQSQQARGPSASPNPGGGGGGPRSRHGSGASVSSVRSASGRLPASMPGTPCSVRKRRSRDVSSAGGSFCGDISSSAAAAAGGASLGGLGGGPDIGFVNFTPNDGSLLMTGVAPSGSSKTKARREKEAQERRRRLSEAALKTVATAGGDVDKLIEQGFAF